MAFRTQDLMISDLSTKGVVLYCTKTSGVCGHITGTTGLTWLTTLTLLTFIPLLHRPLTIAVNPEEAAKQLALLKAQLKEAVKEIEREEESMAEQLKPKTGENAE